MSQQQDPLLDFRNFLYLIWKHLRLPRPTVRQYAIAYYLQHGPKRKIVEAFRGVGKSWVTAAYVLWRLYCNPQVNILVVSASKQRADNFTTFCLRLINEVPFLEHMKPRPDQRMSKVEFDVGPAEPDQNASVRSAGITGQIVGSRADEIVADDIEVVNNSATQMMREKLSELIKEFDSILKPEGDCAITYLGTPQTESSIYNLLPDRGYEIKIWPAVYPDEKQRENYGSRLADDISQELDRSPDLVGRSTEPSRFTDLDLAQRRDSLGRSTFALQFMLDTRLSDADRYPLRLSDLLISPLDLEVAPEKLVWANDKEYIINDLPNVGIGNDRLYRPVPLNNAMYSTYEKYTGSVMSIDPSGRGKDETGYAVVNALHSQLFLMDAGGFNDGYSEATLEALAEVAKRHQVKMILIESNFGDGMFAALFRPILNRIYPCSIEEVRSSVQKEKRIIDTLEPVMNSHKLVVNRSLILKDYASTDHYPEEIASRYQLFYQLTHITRDKGSLATDDRLDALAIAVAYWVNAVAQDTEKARQKSRDKAMDAELRRFMEHALGGVKKRGSWNVRR